jgi:hypothetical protein
MRIGVANKYVEGHIINHGQSVRSEAMLPQDANHIYDRGPSATAISFVFFARVAAQCLAEVLLMKANPFVIAPHAIISLDQKILALACFASCYGRDGEPAQASQCKAKGLILDAPSKAITIGFEDMRR